MRGTLGCLESIDLREIKFYANKQGSSHMKEILKGMLMVSETHLQDIKTMPGARGPGAAAHTTAITALHLLPEAICDSGHCKYMSAEHWGCGQLVKLQRNAKRNISLVVYIPVVRRTVLPTGSGCSPSVRRRQIGLFCGDRRGCE